MRHREYITLTRSRLLPVILRDWLPTVTVYLYSPILASLVEKLWRRDDRRRELCCWCCSLLLSSDALLFSEELEPPMAPFSPPLCSSLTGDAFRCIVSLIKSFA